MTMRYVIAVSASALFAAVAVMFGMVADGMSAESGLVAIATAGGEFGYAVLKSRSA